MSPTITVPLIACVAALLLTPIAARLAHRNGWVDKPGLRKVHSMPVAYLGGAAVVVALLIGLSSILWQSSATHLTDSFDNRVGAIIFGALIMFAVGIVDDVRGLRATSKLIAQLAAGVLVFASGVSIDGLTLAEGVRIDFGAFAAVVTVLWIVGVTNALNIIDGLDGLASGISVVACGAIAWTAFQGSHEVAGILMLALMGSILGFLPYNIHPARVFLGDAGSLTIGFLLSCTAALTATKAPTVMGLGVPLVALGIPILDTLFSMVRRVIERRSILSADRNHLHHRLMALGYGQPKTVLLLCTITAGAVVLTTATAPLGNVWRLLVFFAAFCMYLGVFRATGALRFKESVAAVGRVASAAKATNEEKQAIDVLQLQFREATELGDWWRAVANLAERLEFERMTLALVHREGGTDALRWEASSAKLSSMESTSSDLMHFEIPIADRREGGAPMLRVDVLSTHGLDVVGRRVSLFCRLMTDHSIRSLPSVPRDDVPDGPKAQPARLYA